MLRSLIVAVLSCGSAAAADELSRTAAGEAGQSIGASSNGSGPRAVAFPAGDYYPPNAADPHRRAFSIERLRYGTVGIASSGERRFGLRMGGRLGVFRLESPSQPDRGVQLGVEMGYYGQFDSVYSQDNIGWDGFYGLVLSAGLGPRWAAKLGSLHVSSHVGDEYAERTGRRRYGYTREELMAGLSWRPAKGMRLYAEAGWAYTLRNETVQARRRGQVGVELGSPNLAGGRLGFFAAADVSTWEERDWRIDVAIQGGLLYVSGLGEWRFGVQRYEGRPPLGEFFADDESYTALGVWLDLR